MSVCADIKPALACLNELLREEVANGTNKWDYADWRAEVQETREKYPMAVCRCYASFLAETFL